MRPLRVRFTVREIMFAILAVGILLAWLVGWEQLRISSVRETARAILREDTTDPLASYSSPQEAIAASQHVLQKARMWAEGGPGPFVIVGGAIIELSVIGLSLAIRKAIGLAVRRNRRAREQSKKP